ncbi:hypothetical protein [Enhygromyxa salina]|uniref:hypothetical protein n=1 Tax=Enhygromyxa salina TaxID=215803 RepID=UPI0015E6D1E4|nr:hypothetical protein [Enhygromyxa salina]
MPIRGDFVGGEPCVLVDGPEVFDDLPMYKADGGNERDEHRDEHRDAQQQQCVAPPSGLHGSPAHKVTGWMSQSRSAVPSITTPNAASSR